jgi:hypothetical protein
VLRAEGPQAERLVVETQRRGERGGDERFHRPMVPKEQATGKAGPSAPWTPSSPRHLDDMSAAVEVGIVTPPEYRPAMVSEVR